MIVTSEERHISKVNDVMENVIGRDPAIITVVRHLPDNGVFYGVFVGELKELFC